MKKASASVWTDRDSEYYYIIPEDVDVIEGSFLLKTVTGKERFVDEDSVLPFKVTEEEAKEWLKEQVNQVLDEAKQAFIGAFSINKSKKAEATNGQSKNKAKRQGSAEEAFNDVGDSFRSLVDVLGQAVKNSADLKKNKREATMHSGSEEDSRDPSEILDEGVALLETAATEIEKIAAEAAKRFRVLSKELDLALKKRGA